MGPSPHTIMQFIMLFMVCGMKEGPISTNNPPKITILMGFLGGYWRERRWYPVLALDLGQLPTLLTPSPLPTYTLPPAVGRKREWRRRGE